MSAYEEAVANGFVGTFEQWRNSLIGDEITDNGDPIEATDRLIVERTGSGALQSVPVSQLPASGGGGGVSYHIGNTAPGPEDFPIWINLSGEFFVWDGEAWFEVPGTPGIPGESASMGLIRKVSFLL